MPRFRFGPGGELIKPRGTSGGGVIAAVRDSRGARADDAFELLDVASGQVDVLASRFNGFLNVGAFGELVPCLGRQDVAPAGDCLLQLAFVIGAALSISVEAVLFGSTGAVLGVLEARSDLGNGQLG